jgi:hypothetical protein
LEYEALKVASIIASLIAISILYPLGDSMKIKWSQERERQASLSATERNYNKAKKLSNMWHAIGFWMRTFVLVIFVFSGGLLWGFVGLILISFSHNIMIQIALKQPWYKIGTTAKTDIFLRKVWTWIVTQYNKIITKLKK